MRDYAKQQQPVSRTIDSNPKAANQASISEILQRYKKTIIQPAGLEDEDELLQGKFSDNPIQQASTENEEPLQPKSENKTGLPDDLKTGIENMSGYSMDDVKVHYNSDKPTQLNAFAYAQGTDIHVAPGQEKHLPHEAWHVVQQKQGRVQPTMQLQGVNVNDNEGLEKEVDVMGKEALQFKVSNEIPIENGDCNNKNNTLNTQSYKFKKTAITSTSTLQKATIPLAETESELNANWKNDTIVYPGIDSCIGITVAINNDTHRLLGTHLVAPYELNGAIDGYVLQLGQIITIVEGANPDEAIVHISTDNGDIEGNIATHLQYFQDDALNTRVNEWFTTLKNNHNANQARWNHIRYDKNKPGDLGVIGFHFPDYEQQFRESGTRHLNVPNFQPIQGKFESLQRTKTPSIKNKNILQRLKIKLDETEYSNAELLRDGQDRPYKVDGPYVIKIFRDNDGSNEFEVMEAIKGNENVVNVIKKGIVVFIDEPADSEDIDKSKYNGRPAILMEYANYGDLDSIFKNTNKKEEIIASKKKIADGIVKGLNHINKQKIHHGDLDSKNVFVHKSVTGEFIAKVADFGTSEKKDSLLAGNDLLDNIRGAYNALKKLGYFSGTLPAYLVFGADPDKAIDEINKKLEDGITKIEKQSI